MLRKLALSTSLLFPVLILASSTFAQEIFPLAGTGDTFRGIVPFVTTRIEVEKKLGKPTKDSHYEFDRGWVYIFYRETKCESSNRECLCLAPIDSVAVVIVNLHYDLKIEDLKLDPVIWTKGKTSGGHVAGDTVFYNVEKGIAYDVTDGLVTTITYRVAEKTCKMLEESGDNPIR